MKPGDRAHRRWPVPKNVSLVLVPGQRLSEYDIARVYEYFATLYSVIDGLTAKSQETPQSSDNFFVTLNEHHKRIAALEESLARITDGL